MRYGVRAIVFILHRSDTLLRAIVQLLASEGYRVRSADTIEALHADLASAGGPAVLVVDEDTAGSGWLAMLDRVPPGIPVVALTWYPRARFPEGVTPIGKPFGARQLLGVLSANAPAHAPGAPGGPR